MYVPPDEPIQESGEINMTFAHAEAGAMSGTHMPRHGQQGYVTGSNGAARYEDGGAISAVNPIYQRSVVPEKHRIANDMTSKMANQHQLRSSRSNHVVQRSTTSAARPRQIIVTNTSNGSPRWQKPLPKGFDYLPRNRKPIDSVTDPSMHNGIILFRPINQSSYDMIDSKNQKTTILSQNRNLKYDSSASISATIYDNSTITNYPSPPASPITSSHATICPSPLPSLKADNPREDFGECYGNSETLQQGGRIGLDLESTSSGSVNQNTIATRPNSLFISHFTPRKVSNDNGNQLDISIDDERDTSIDIEGAGDAHSLSEISDLRRAINVHTPPMEVTGSILSDTHETTLSDAETRSVIYVTPDSPMYATVKSVSQSENSLVFRL